MCGGRRISLITPKLGLCEYEPSLSRAQEANIGGHQTCLCVSLSLPGSMCAEAPTDLGRHGHHLLSLCVCVCVCVCPHRRETTASTLRDTEIEM
jgi:hypothetical protein